MGPVELQLLLVKPPANDVVRRPAPNRPALDSPIAGIVPACRLPLPSY